MEITIHETDENRCTVLHLSRTTEYFGTQETAFMLHQLFGVQYFTAIAGYNLHH